MIRQTLDKVLAEQDPAKKAFLAEQLQGNINNAKGVGQVEDILAGIEVMDAKRSAISKQAQIVKSIPELNDMVEQAKVRGMTEKEAVARAFADADSVLNPKIQDAFSAVSKVVNQDIEQWSGLRDPNAADVRSAFDNLAAVLRMVAQLKGSSQAKALRDRIVSQLDGLAGEPVDRDWGVGPVKDFYLDLKKMKL
jgi:hypothetical protein